MDFLRCFAGLLILSLLILAVVSKICAAWGAERAAQEQAAAEREAAEKRAQRQQLEDERNAAAEREAAEKRAERKQREDARIAAALAKQAEQARRQAAKLEAARQLAEYKERELIAARELQAMRRAENADATPPRHSEAAPAQAAATPPHHSEAVTLAAFAAANAPRPFPVACMLAKKYAENARALDGKAFTVTEKLDGVRCIARVDHGSVALYARSGNRLEGLNEIERALASLDVAAVLDGELLINGRGARPSKDEYKQTCSILRTMGEKKGIVYHVFDMLPLAEYEQRRPTIPYSARRASLARLEGLTPCVEVVPVLYAGTDAAQIEKQLEAQRAARHEGVMINLDDAPYSFTRSACLLKYKVMSDCDLQIVGVNQGTGRNADSLGSLSMEYKGGIVRVSAGIPTALRRAIWDNPSAYIGRVATVQYFEETQDRSGKKSLRFPAFVELREPGKAVSYA